MWEPCQNHLHRASTGKFNYKCILIQTEFSDKQQHPAPSHSVPSIYFVVARSREHEGDKKAFMIDWSP